jgi:hypothetical protein
MMEREEAVQNWRGKEREGGWWFVREKHSDQPAATCPDFDPQGFWGGQQPLMMAESLITSQKVPEGAGTVGIAGSCDSDKVGLAGSL